MLAGEREERERMQTEAEAARGQLRAEREAHATNRATSLAQVADVC